MAMYPCKTCYKNDWSFEFSDITQWVRATCKNCGDSVSWKSKKKQEPRQGTGASCEGKTVDGQLYRKEKDGLFYPVEYVDVKGGKQFVANRFVKGIE